jgi:DNA polymerase III subunit delta
VAVHLLTGDDPSLLSAGVTELVHRLVGDGDRALMVDDLDAEPEGFEVRTAVEAAQTPPFLTERRIVVVRNVGSLVVDELAPLLGYLGDPLPTTELVLVGGGGRLAKALTDAVKAAGGHVQSLAAPTRAGDRSQWIKEQVALAGLHLDDAAVRRVSAWFGEDAGRVGGFLETLTAAFGVDRTLKLSDVEPFLGAAGSVPPWDLTDAIDRGDTAAALSLLTRMMQAGERHPLQIMAILHGHYQRVLRLDGAGVTDAGAAATLLGLKGDFQARKALDLLGRIGSGGVARAFSLLAQADLDLRGAKEWPDHLVMEVLVARLSRLAPAGVGAQRR